MEHQPDEILDGFRLIKKVGSGAEGSVWKAVHQDEEGRMAAIKFGSGEKTPFPELHHPNLVGVEDQGISKGSPYLRMEWVEGESLRDYIDREGKLPSEKVSDLALQLARAIDYLHDKEIVHGDLKPSNILITPEGTLKVTDFGLDVAEPDIAVSTKANDEIIGTVGYLAPELKKGARPDQKSDLYSLGAVIHEMITGELPPGHLPPEWEPTVSTLLTDRNHRLDSASKLLGLLGGREGPQAKPWYLESWMAGPMTILGIFMISYLSLGMQGLQPVLRFLLLLPGLALALFFSRGIRAPGATALFWGGLFWAYAARAIHVGLSGLGFALALGGFVWYCQKTFRKQKPS